jgi:hypothetical protein
MKEEKHTHWKKLSNPDYLGAYDFQPNEERIVTVKDVKREIVKGQEGSEEHTILHFVEPYKPMIMNATNSKMLSKLAESPYIEQWVGKSFKLVVVRIKAFGEMMDALRIKSEKVVKILPILEIGSENFVKCQTAIKGGKATIEQVKQKYSVSKETEEALNG